MAKIKIPNIPESEKTPIVKILLEIGLLQQEQIQILEDEIARLKGDKPTPKRKPSNLEKKPKKKKPKKRKKRPGSKKREKTSELEIHETIKVPPTTIPAGSRFKGYSDFTIQDIIFKTHNIKYRIEYWASPDGKLHIGELPSQGRVGHIGSTLYSFILYQYYHARVTQPLIYEQLKEIGVDISTGQVNRIITEGKDLFHKEKEEILRVGLEVSTYANVDDTGARHQGKNGFCTHIGNQLFAWFESTETKSRINFLKLLRRGHVDYVLNEQGINYMQTHKLPKGPLTIVKEHQGEKFESEQQWNDFLNQVGITNKRHITKATEGALLGSIIEHGLSKEFIILSDDAGQFDVLSHALCWIHAERSLHKLVGVSEDQRIALKNKTQEIWEFYNELKAYKLSPCPKTKQKLDEQFGTIFMEKTCFLSLNKALRRLYNNKSELLLVLEQPEIPLHNNESERDIREYVTKRKISGSTRSESGRRCRDTFASLKKTCRKLHLSFWTYLNDRISGLHKIPTIGTLIRHRAEENLI